MKTTIKGFFEKDKEYGLYFYKRSIGKLPEMFSAIALSELLRKFYKKGMKILDVACGTGHYLRSFRKRIDPEIDYFGIDSTSNYIRLAKKAFNKKIFKKGDIEKIPFNNNEFDVVMANNIILHMPPDPIKSLSELIRVSRKYVIVRTVFGERNYIIQEVSSKKDFCRNATDSDSEKLFDKKGVPLLFNYFNIYTEDYFRSAIKSIVPKCKLKIIRDISFKPFDNRRLTRNTGTRVINGIQVSGSLLLDWRFIVIEKTIKS